MHFIHQINIIIHIIAGTLALGLGFVAAIIYKKTKWHIKFGRWFVRIMALVVLTGLIGVFIFQRNGFLLLITLLSGYNCFSGIRAIRLKGSKPMQIDRGVSVILLAIGSIYFYCLQSSSLYWSPVVIYSTLSALLLVVGYDLLKNVLNFNFRMLASRYEHVYKMISAVSGLASAFTGTVFPQYHPYSQFLPSVLGLCWIVTTFIIINHASTKFTLNQK